MFIVYNVLSDVIKFTKSCFFFRKKNIASELKRIPLMFDINDLFFIDQDSSIEHTLPNFIFVKVNYISWKINQEGNNNNNKKNIDYSCNRK